MPTQSTSHAGYAPTVPRWGDRVHRSAISTHEVDILRVGRQHPKIYRKYLLMKLSLYATIGVLFV
jgi:hypothetical protein